MYYIKFVQLCAQATLGEALPLARYDSSTAIIVSMTTIIIFVMMAHQSDWATMI